VFLLLIKRFYGGTNGMKQDPREPLDCKYEADQHAGHISGQGRHFETLNPPTSGSVLSLKHAHHFPHFISLDTDI
jgi:hypothetical protein